RIPPILATEPDGRAKSDGRPNFQRRHRAANPAKLAGGESGRPTELLENIGRDDCDVCGGVDEEVTANPGACRSLNFSGNHRSPDVPARVFPPSVESHGSLALCGSECEWN